MGIGDLIEDDQDRFHALGGVEDVVEEDVGQGPGQQRDSLMHGAGADHPLDLLARLDFRRGQRPGAVARPVGGDLLDPRSKGAPGVLGEDQPLDPALMVGQGRERGVHAMEPEAGPAGALAFALPPWRPPRPFGRRPGAGGGSRGISFGRLALCHDPPYITADSTECSTHCDSSATLLRRMAAGAFVHAFCC